MEDTTKELIKRGTITFGICLLIGLVFITIVSIFSNHQTEINTHTQSFMIPQGISSPQIKFDGLSLIDSTIFNESENICFGERNGMSIRINPCVAQDIDRNNIEQNINFTWKGANPQNVGWIFAYDGDLINGKVFIDKLITRQNELTRYVNDWINNYLVLNVLNYTDLGNPDDRCEKGNKNNSFMFNVLNQNGTSIIYCFSQRTIINSSAFRISGNYDKSEIYFENVTNMELFDVTDRFTKINNPLNDNKSYYRVDEVLFNPSQSINTHWIFTPKDRAKVGKWHILGYNADIGLIQSIVNDQYVYFDPWWNSDWSKRVQILVAPLPSPTNIDYSVSIYINKSLYSSMNETFKDIRFTSELTGLELPYYISNVTNNSFAWVYVKMNLSNSENTTLNMYYGNNLVSSTSNIKTAFLFGDDFEDSSFDTSIWNNATGSAYSETGGYLQMTNSNTFINSKINLSGNYTFYSVYNATTKGAIDFGNNLVDNLLNVGARNRLIYQITSNTANLVLYADYNGGGYDVNGVNIRTDFTAGKVLKTWTYVTTSNFAINTTAGGAINSSSIYSTGFDSPMTFYYGNYGTGTSTAFDYRILEVYAKKLSYNEPLYYIGAEENSEGLSVIQSYPPNLFSSSNKTIDFQCNYSAIGVNITSIKIEVYNSTNYKYFNMTEIGLSTQSYNKTFPSTNFTDDSYTWACYGFGTSGVNGTSSNRTFTIHRVSPIITLNNNISNVSLLELPLNITLNYTANDEFLQNCWWNVSSNATRNIFTCNTTQTITFLNGGNKEIYYYANDSFGNENSSLAQFYIYYVQPTATANNPISEGGLSSHSLTLNLDNITNWNVNARLYWNNTFKGYGTQTNVSNNQMRFDLSFVVPIINSSTNLTNWIWYYNITGNPNIANWNVSGNQTIVPMAISECATGLQQILNYTLYDEKTKTLSDGTNATIEVDMTLTSNEDSSISQIFYGKKQNVNSYVICLPAGALNNTSYRLDSIAKYDYQGHVVEYNYIVNFNLTNATAPQLKKLYDLSITESTSFLVTYQDENYLYVEDAVIDVWRYYVGDSEFISVEHGKTDAGGQTRAHLVTEDIIYKALVYKKRNSLIYESRVYRSLPSNALSNQFKEISINRRIILGL